MSARWFRVYEDMIDDPKVQRLPADLFRALVNLWCLASACGGALPAAGDIAFKLRKSEAETSKIINGLLDAKLLDRDGETFLPHNWNGRQFKSDVSTDRVQHHRQRKRNVSGNVSVTPPEAETDSETEAAQQTVSEIAKQDIVEVQLRTATGPLAPESQDITPILELIDKGYDLAKHILPVVRDRASKATKRFSSWRYFVAAIEESRATNGAIKPNGSTPTEPQAWLPAESPLWDAMAERWQHDRGKALRPMPSNRESGAGAYVPKAWLDMAAHTSGTVN